MTTSTLTVIFKDWSNTTISLAAMDSESLKEAVAEIGRKAPGAWVRLEDGNGVASSFVVDDVLVLVERPHGR